jgi:RHS repeat-associated protein
VYYLGGGPADATITFSLSTLTADDVSWSHTETSSARVEKPPGSGQWFIETTTWTTGEDWRIDWSDPSLRPEPAQEDAWSAIAANLASQIGTEWGDYVVALDADANALHALGQDTNDVSKLYQFEVAKASASLNPVRYLAGSIDASIPAPGLAISFSRVYGESITARDMLGPLGRGWTTNWDVRAAVQTNGDVVLRGPGGVDRSFTLEHNGSYQGSSGDTGVLTLSGGAYRLTESDQPIWQFHTDGTLDYVADPNGNRITLGYTNGLLTSLTHSDGQQLLIDYNAQGRIAHVTNPLGPGPADDLVTTYAYDATGEHLMQVTQPGGRVTTYSYDTNDGVQREHALLSVAYPDGTHDFFAYDSQGRLIQTSGDQGGQKITYAYDQTGGVTVTDATGRTTFLAYGLNGLLEQVRDGDGRIVDLQNCQCGHLQQLIGPSGERYDYSYDSRGNLTGIRDPMRQTTSFTYDPTFNQITSVTDARGNGMNYGYDSQGNLTSISYADGTKETYTYDSQGNVLSATNRRGQVLNYTYNAAGQVLTKDDPTTPGIDGIYTYDAAGNLTSTQDSSGTTRMAYDPNTNLLTRIDYPGGLFFTFEYDAAGRRTKRTDQDGHVENSTYDALGRLDTMTDEHGALIVHYEYDAAGRLSKKTLGNGVYTLYVYDNGGNVTRLLNLRADSSVLSRFDYTYDASGRQSSMTTLDGTFTYSYDPLGQLTSVTYPNGHIVSYDYDAAGNRIEVDDNGVVTSYVTNNLNQYTAVGDATYTYDPDGNMTSKTEGGVTTRYSYDVENRLVGVTTPTDNWTFRYDAFGNRIASTHNAVTTGYVTDPAGLGNVAAEYDGSGTLVARYDYGYGLVARIDGTGSDDFYTFSAIGNTSEVTNTAGITVDQYTYDPFGATLTKHETVANPFQYGGAYGAASESTGIGFMRSRYYDPKIGRFTGVDPIAVTPEDAYRYADNRPTSLIDPLGLESCDSEDSDINAAYQYHYAYWRGVTSKEFRFWGEFFLEMYAGALAGVGAGYAGLVKFKLALLLPSLRNVKELWNMIHDLGGPYGGTNDSKGSGDSTNTGSWNECGTRGSSTGDPNWTGNHDSSSSSTSLFSADPNNKIGPGGFGDAAYVPSNNTLAYEIRFENESTATAPAQRVVVTDTLDPSLDLKTLELTEIDFANQTIAIPPDLDHYEATAPITANGAPILVHVQADLDRATRQLSLALDAVDPATGWYPDNPLIGFLYPENGAGQGVGSISYSISPLSDLPSGTVIQNRASIVFDYNDPIDTPMVHNTLDAGPPTSAVAALPASTTDTTLNLSWSGQDDAGGSGIAPYTIYVSVDSEAPLALFTDTTNTSGTVTVEPGHTYSFYSIATDNVGHVESPPSAPDATIQVIGAIATTTVQPSKQNPTYGDSLTFTATVSPVQSGAGTPTGTVQFIFDGANLGSPVALSGGVATSTPIATLSAGSHTISAKYSGDIVFSPDNATDFPFSVSKATVTVKGDDKAKNYGGADPTLTYTVTGLLNGDAKSVVTGITLSTTTGAAATAGTHTILVTGGTAANYTVIDANGTLTVSKAPLTVTADDKNKQLGAPDPTLTYTVTGTLFYGDGSSIVSGVTLSTAIGPAATVGNHVITITGGTATNYSITDVSGTLTVTRSTEPPPLVSMTRILFVTNKKHLVTQIIVTLSGPVNAAEAQSASTYRLATAGKKNSFDAKNAKLITLKSAAYNSATNSITLTPNRPFALTKPVQLRINGQPPSGLQDSLGRLIDGDHNGTAGGSAVAVLRRSGATISAVGSVHSDKVQALKPDSVDALFGLENPLQSNRVASAARAIYHSSRHRYGGSSSRWHL